MKPSPSFPARYAAAIVGLVLVVAIFAAARLPEPPADERASIAARFRFQKTELPEMPGRAHQIVRKVAPSLKRIDGWISAVGAAATLADLDGDGLPNDIIHVETRTDLITVMPAPGNGARYPMFTLDAAPLKYDATMAPMGTVAADLNEDGLMDVLALYWGRPPIAFLRKPTRGPLARSAYVAREIVEFERWYTSAATTADVDGDGHLDIVVGNYFQDGARILDETAAGVEVMHDTKSRSFNGGWNRILLLTGETAGTEPTVAFRDVKGVFDEEVARGWTLALGAADLDGDMLPEIYFANDFGPDRLMHNRSTPGHPKFVVLEGKRTLKKPKSCVLGHDSFKGMGCDFGDVNGDGLLDIYVSNIAAQYALHESHFLWLSTGETQRMKDGFAPYVQGSEELGLSRSSWGWESRLADFDNDGVLEAYQATGFMKGAINRWPELQSLGTANDQIMHDPTLWPTFHPGADLCGHDPNFFFVRAADGRYYDVAGQVGLGGEMNSRGIATADVDGDGRLDCVVANQFEPSYFFHNDSPSTGAFLGLHLLLPAAGTEANAPIVIRAGHPDSGVKARPAVGAEARIRLADGRLLVAQVDGGNGYTGRRSPEIIFGLGRLGGDAKIKVELRWRDGQGVVRKSTIEVVPGWHTVLLGREQTSA